MRRKPIEGIVGQGAGGCKLTERVESDVALQLRKRVITQSRAEQIENFRGARASIDDERMRRQIDISERQPNVGFIRQR